MTNIILCGGNGTRLWPISRTLLPKQFVKLFKDRSLFQKTCLRNHAMCNQRFIVSNAEQYFLANDQLAELDLNASNFLLEPLGRNTAPAIALACMTLSEDEIVFVTPSDHLIKDDVAYEKVLQKAKEYAENDYLVTFGITPTYPETGYGYIEIDKDDNVEAFHEKPDMLKAQHYIEAGNYLWNSGMFCFKSGVFLQELKKFAPDIYKGCEDALLNAKRNTIIRIGHHEMMQIPEESIDYAVMEKSRRIKVIESDIGWSDVGSFDSLFEELPHDSCGNSISEHTITVNSHNNMIMTDGRLIAAVDVDDLVIIDTSDALLVTKKGSSQQVKEVVARIKEKGSQLHHIHDTAYRPWGTYTVLENETSYKIKRIVVKSGKRLSLQKHFHRSEHWVVVSGTAMVEIEGKETIVRANESTFIPMGMLHRLSNPGKIDLILIEVQVGEYTGEDDIVRIEDDYKRI